MKDKHWLYFGLGILAILIFVGQKVIGNNKKLTQEFDPLFIKYANKYGLSPLMLKTISMNESYLGRYRQLEPIGGTSGLMHIKLSTARDFFPKLTAKDLAIDEVQIESASAFLAWIKKQVGDDEKKIVMSYNQGVGNTKNGKNFAQPYWDKYEKNKKTILG